MVNTFDNNENLTLLKYQERIAATRDSCRMRVIDLVNRNRDKFLTEKEWFDWLNKQIPDAFKWSAEEDYIGYYEVIDLLRWLEGQTQFIVNRNSMKDQVIKFLLNELQRVGSLQLRDGRTVQQARDNIEPKLSRWQRVKRCLTKFQRF